MENNEQNNGLTNQGDNIMVGNSNNIESTPSQQTTANPGVFAPNQTITGQPNAVNQTTMESSMNQATVQNMLNTAPIVPTVDAEPVVIPKGEKPKKSGVLGYIIILLLMIVSCAALYYYLIILPKKNNTVTDNTLYTKETLPRVDASLATQPLVDALVLDFTGKTTTEMGIEYSNTDPAYTKLINNETDLIVVTEPSADELKRAEAANIELEVTKVVNEGFVFFVNKNNKVDSLTLEEIRKIYSGEITNWKEVGGDDTEIIAYQRPENSGSQTGLYSLVMKELPVKARTPKEQVTLSMAGIIEYVSDYKNGLDAIGYSYYYYANEMYFNEDLKYLGVNGIKPTYDTIKDETYPILTAYYIVTRKGETNENVIKLKEDMLSRRGQNVATKAGYVPCK